MSKNTPRAAVALRHIIVSGLTAPHGDSITGVNTFELPFGAECFVNDTGGVYRLDKSLTVAPGASPAFITPTAGPGIWVLQGQSPATSTLAAAFDGNAGMNDSPTSSLVVNVWAHFPVNGDAGALYEGSGDYWSIDVETGVMTYSGPDARRFLVTGIFSAIGDTADQLLEIALTENAALIGASTFVAVSTQAGTADTLPVSMTLSSLITLDNGDTIQHILRNSTATPGAITFKRYSVTIIGA